MDRTDFFGHPLPRAHIWFNRVLGYWMCTRKEGGLPVGSSLTSPVEAYTRWANHYRSYQMWTNRRY